jgi:ABC-type nitrate/sulfonate/bicarbonate transport system permease component
VVLPSSVPLLLAGLRLLGHALVGTVVGEMDGATRASAI